MNSSHEQSPDFNDVGVKLGEEHSVLQNAIGEIRTIPNPALRLVVAEHLQSALDEVIEESVSETIANIRLESKEVH